LHRQLLDFVQHEYHALVLVQVRQRALQTLQSPTILGVRRWAGVLGLDRVEVVRRDFTPTLRLAPMRRGNTPRDSIEPTSDVLRLSAAIELAEHHEKHLLNGVVSV